MVLAGPPASGKSTLAAELSRRSGLPVVSSDVTRKRLAGLAPSRRAPVGRYSERHTEETYRALGRAAARHLQGGTGVLVDATCGTRRRRAALLDALDGARTLFVECRVPLACALRRAGERTAQPGAVSDATPEVVARLFDAYEQIRELPGGTVVVVDGRAPLADQLESVRSALDDVCRTMTT